VSTFIVAPLTSILSCGIGGLKPLLLHVGAPPRYSPGHQVSLGQELGLATKAHAKWVTSCTGHLDAVFTWHLDSDLDTLAMVWMSSMGPRNSTNMISQIC